MENGIAVQRGLGVGWAEMPDYVGFMGIKCYHCGSPNTVYEVYRRSIEGRCLSCERTRKHAIPEWVPVFVREYVWRGELHARP